MRHSQAKHLVQGSYVLSWLGWLFTGDSFQPSHHMMATVNELLPDACFQSYGTGIFVSFNSTYLGLRSVDSEVFHLLFLSKRCEEEEVDSALHYSGFL